MFSTPLTCWSIDAATVSETTLGVAGIEQSTETVGGEIGGQPPTAAGAAPRSRQLA